ncbi:MAG: alcohol dehydrogenase catalytic domain-containing protein [Chthoniobacterales bacterium]|nr:alcohol dehydrogenase catalytic domain-containing protein [Chthoniobacterales bacterium]
MKTVRLVQLGQPLQDVEIAVPELGSTDVLVRVAASGICHSDAHYRAGISPIAHLPVTPGHEVAGTVEQVGHEVVAFRPGDRVCVHYLAHCGACDFCLRGHEQFCPDVEMIGKHRDGGYAEFIKVPARSLFALPDEIPFAQGAIMMCSSATALHALNKARLQPGESVAIIGFGGLGYSALQLARAFDCGAIYVVDINPAKLATAAALGAIPISATVADPVQQIRDVTGGKGVDVSIELVGTAATMNQAVRCLDILGRAAIVALSRESLSLLPYSELINKEAEVIGVSDHLASELPSLMRYAQSGKLTFPESALRFVDLDATQINAALDALHGSTDHVRSVIRV